MSSQSQRTRISTGTIWEKQVGYSRAVRAGNFVFVSGTTATADDGSTVGIGDAEEQTRFIVAKIERSLQDAGASLRDVVRTRAFVVNAKDWEAVGRAHAAYFKDIQPAMTLVEVSALIGEDYLVEIEADAVIDAG